MTFRFVTRETYRRDKKLLMKNQKRISRKFGGSEGGTNENAVEGIQFMLNEETQDFDYLCSAIGTGRNPFWNF